MNWLLIGFMIFLEAACRESLRLIPVPCIDGNACKENSADERWVGIGVLLTQLGSIVKNMSISSIFSSYLV